MFGVRLISSEAEPVMAIGNGKGVASLRILSRVTV